MSELAQFRDTDLAIPRAGEPIETIGFYPREFYVCDNFSAFQVEYGGVEWPTAEHLYQAAHFFESDPNLVEQILHAPSAQRSIDILKAADALDRFRMPKQKWWPQPELIHLRATHTLLETARLLTIQSEQKILEGTDPVSAVVAVAQELFS